MNARAGRATQASTGASAAGRAARLSDIATIRTRARQHIERGAVTDNYGANRETVIRLLNEALATELVCTLRYRRHYYMANGFDAESVRQEFLTHANEELEHADRIATRIVQLQGEPNFDPVGLADRSHAEYVTADSLRAMVEEDLIAERIAIESYGEIINYIGASDPTTRRLFEDILAKEEEHAEELSSFLTSDVA
jgi:bacterioferritin